MMALTLKQPWAKLLQCLNRPQREYLDRVLGQSPVAEAVAHTTNRVTRKHHKSVRSGSKKERLRNRRIDAFAERVFDIFRE